MKTHAIIFLACLTGTAALSNGFKYECELFVPPTAKTMEPEQRSAVITFDSATQTEKFLTEFLGYGLEVSKVDYVYGEVLQIFFFSGSPDEGSFVGIEVPMGTPWARVRTPQFRRLIQEVTVDCRLVKHFTTPPETP